jgi:hypothetical protein
VIRRRSSVALILVFLAALSAAGGQEVEPSRDLDMASIGAQDEFAWGVRSFHSFLYNEAIRSFERSLSYKPDNPLTRYWLGLAYMRSGLDETALSIWRSLLDMENIPPITEAKIEILSWKRGVGKELTGVSRHLVSFNLPSREGDLRVFARPSSVAVGKNGDFYVASYASNEVLLFSINAGLRTRITGGLAGFTNPFDILSLPERNLLFVSEYGADRIARSTLDGKEILRFGKRGRGPGEFLGPQYLAIDGDGYLYVSDVGNRRISKFDINGTFLFSFGTRTGDFPGLQEPSGIVVMEVIVYVSEARKKEIAAFDTSGNYIASFGTGILSKPEGLSLFRQGEFLVADGPRVYRFISETEEFVLLSDFAGNARRVTKAVQAKDGIVLVTDFEGDSIFFLSDFHGLYSNLDVEIGRVDSAKFPVVQVDLTVTDTSGNPMIGLDSSNFLVTERRRDVGDFEITYIGNVDSQISLALLVERSPQMKNFLNDTGRALKAITDALPRGGRMRVVSASAEPVVEIPVGSQPRQFASLGSLKSGLDPGWRFDTGLRLAASELLGDGAKRAVVFITSGVCPPHAFEQYSLVELAQYLRNNHIQFSCVSVDPAKRPVAPEYRYLCDETGGSVLLLYQPEGIGLIVTDLLEKESGRYMLRYTSKEPGDFGNTYIPVEVEVHHFSRSGRDELGYFAPITY